MLLNAFEKVMMNNPVRAAIQRRFEAKRLDHPMEDRFDRATFAAALRDVGFGDVRSKELLGQFAWFVADR